MTGFTWQWVVLGSTEQYWAVLGGSGSEWVVLGCTWLQWAVLNRRVIGTTEEGGGRGQESRGGKEEKR